MMDGNPRIALQHGLDLRQVVTTGSILHINEDYDDADFNQEPERKGGRTVDFIGEPVDCFDELEKDMTPVDSSGFVKKKILDDGGGLPLHEGCTVYIAFSGYWEKETEPFDVMKSDKPLVVDLSNSGLLPGLHTSIESMLVGEMSVFLLSYQVMYGELGNPPRIKPKSKCVFYIQLLKSILTPKEGHLEVAAPNMFQRTYIKVKQLYGSGVTLYKTNNYPAAIQIFRKAVFMLHKCRLADENEQVIQEKMLKRLYINLAICNNAVRQPLKACVACNELNRLDSLWNNPKALFQNAKALRMIGQFDDAEKRLKRAVHLSPDCEQIKAEFELIRKSRDSFKQSKVAIERMARSSVDFISEDFKKEMNVLITNFKENNDLCKLTLPESLNSAEIMYVKDICVKENLFFSKIQKDYALDKDEEFNSSGASIDDLRAFVDENE